MRVPISLSQFAQDLRQEVVGRVENADEGGFYTDAFTEILIEHLQELVGEPGNTKICSHQSTGNRGAILQMNGYGLSENGEHLTLLITHYTGNTSPPSISSSEITTAFARLGRLYNEAVNGIHERLEESSTTFAAIYAIWEAAKVGRTLLHVRFILLTDAVIPDSFKLPSDQFRENIHFDYDIWDIGRLYRLISSGQQRDKIEVDFVSMIGQAIPCLAQPDLKTGYAAYLTIFPGNALVELYGKYGSRLLERNVRSFLQARGTVNKGIRNTIVNEPHMFFAFNNGITITAESVDLVNIPGGGIGIKTIRDLQIVNGGQTTASIFYTVKRDRSADAGRIFVQAKITVISDPGHIDSIVPIISRYSNSQNKIQDADLVANDAYHRRIEELSRTIWAPAKDGSLRQTRWFYERARGQYIDEITRERTPARIKAFQNIHPKSQLFTKTELTKYQMTWEMMPHLVSRGSQKCLNAFMDASHMELHHLKEGELDQKYFERLVARAILFRTTEGLLRKQSLLYPGYRAFLVTYALSRLVHETQGRIDLGQIWRDQAVPDGLKEAIMDIVKSVWAFITTENKGSNIAEFCKKVTTPAHFLRFDVHTEGGFAQFSTAPTDEVKATPYASIER